MRDILTKWKIIFIILLIYLPIFIKTSKELEFIILYYILISIFVFQIIYSNQNFYIDIKIIVYFLIGLAFIILQILPIGQNLLKYLSPKSAYYLSLIENTNYYSISLNFFNTLKYLLIYLSACMIIIGIRNIIKSKRDLLNTYRFFFLITFFYIFYSYISYLNHNKNLDGLSSTIINRNNFCFYLILCFISLLSYMNFFKKYFYNKKNDFIQLILSDIFIARIAIVLISIGIILTKSRSGNTTFLVILIFYFALDYLRNKKLTFNSKIIISIFFIDIFLINYFVGLNQVISRFAEINFTNEELRIDTFQFSFLNLKNFLFFGYGLGNFESLFRLEIGSNNYFYDHVHNDYLEFFGELGLIGSLIFFIIFIKFTRYIINFQKLVFLKDQFFLIFLACVVHGLFDFALHMPSIIYVTVFLFGLSSCNLKRSIL